jgi:hypothetical protein
MFYISDVKTPVFENHILPLIPCVNLQHKRLFERQSAVPVEILIFSDMKLKQWAYVSTLE